MTEIKVDSDSEHGMIASSILDTLALSRLKGQQYREDLLFVNGAHLWLKVE